MSPNRQIHVILFDGTFASLDEGRDSNIGRIHALLARAAPRLRMHYVAGQQWEAWSEAADLALCRAIPSRISTAYGWLASRYRPGDTVFMFGYSRGAFAVRSLAGMVGRVGLLQPAHATERNVRLAWDWYQRGDASPRGLSAFRRRCHDRVPIRMVGVFDTVKAMGLRLPLLWLLTERRYAFHDHHACAGVENALQALALDETRAVFEPVLWQTDTDEGAPRRIRQMWFRGCHADIGGQLSGYEAARGLSNLPLVWMLEEAEALGLPLPPGWRAGLPTDPSAPAVGSWRGWGKMFLLRAPRLAGADGSEHLHASVAQPYDGPALLTGALAGKAARPLPLRRRAADHMRGIAGGRLA